MTISHTFPHRRQGRPVEIKDAVVNQRYTDFMGAELLVIKREYLGQWVYGIYPNTSKAPITSSGVIVYAKS